MYFGLIQPCPLFPRKRPQSRHAGRSGVPAADIPSHDAICNNAVDDDEQPGPNMSTFNVGFVLFPDLTQLDFTGPQQVLARMPQSAMHIVAKSNQPVPSDSGLSLVPTHTFESCPRLDLICVPGVAGGVVQALGD